MADPPKVSTAKGGGLTRKVGPLPMYAWVIVAALGVYVAYRVYRSHQTTAAAAIGSTVDPNAIDPNTGLPYSQEQLASPTLGGTPQPNDQGSSGGGGDSGLGQSNQDALVSALQAQQAADAQLYAPLLSNQGALLAALASSPSAQSPSALTGSIAGSGVDPLVTVATGAPSSASPTSASHPASSALTHNVEPNLGVMSSAPTFFAPAPGLAGAAHPSGAPISGELVTQTFKPAPGAGGGGPISGTLELSPVPQPGTPHPVGGAAGSAARGVIPGATSRRQAVSRSKTLH